MIAEEEAQGQDMNTQGRPQDAARVETNRQPNILRQTWSSNNRKSLIKLYLHRHGFTHGRSNLLTSTKKEPSDTNSAVVALQPREPYHILPLPSYSIIASIVIRPSTDTSSAAVAIMLNLISMRYPSKTNMCLPSFAVLRDASSWCAH